MLINNLENFKSYKVTYLCKTRKSVISWFPAFLNHHILMFFWFLNQTSLLKKISKQEKSLYDMEFEQGNF